MKSRPLIRRGWRYFSKPNENEHFRVKGGKVQHRFPYLDWTNYHRLDTLEKLKEEGWKEITENESEKYFKERELNFNTYNTIIANNFPNIPSSNLYVYSGQNFYTTSVCPPLSG